MFAQKMFVDKRIFESNDGATLSVGVCHKVPKSAFASVSATLFLCFTS